jgi:hypothetical protein
MNLGIDSAITDMLLNVAMLGSALVVLTAAGNRLLWALWYYIDRGESSFPILLLNLLRVYSVRGIDREGDKVYLTPDDRRCWTEDGAAMFFSKKKAQAFADNSQFKDEDFKVYNQMGEVSAAFLLIILLLAGCGVLKLISLAPMLVLTVIGVVGSVVMARLLRDGQKALTKFSKAVKTHINDKDAHTPNAQEVDLEYRMDTKIK